jgi:glycosyltransferase involved in cell wall biosynthesis
MITVVLPTFNHAHVLGHVLASLVPAALDGLVKEVVVADAGSTDATLEVAEDAGARIVVGVDDRGLRLAAGCEAARGTWLMSLDPEAVLPEAWRAAVEDHLLRRPSADAWIAGSARFSLATLLSGPPIWGVLARRDRYLAAGGFQAGTKSERALIRKLGAKPLAY